MGSKGPTGRDSTALQRLEHVEIRLAEALDSAAKVMEELGSGAKSDVTVRYSKAFMDAVTEVQLGLRAEISTLWDHKPFENCEYIERMGAQVALEEVAWMESQVDDIAVLLSAHQQDAAAADVDESISTETRS